MSPEENKAILLAFFKELARNPNAVEEFCSPSFTFRSPNFPGWPRGLDGARKLAVAGLSLFADASSHIDDVFAGDDKVAVRFTIRGKYIGEPKNGFPNPGERFSMGAIAIYRFVDGKIEEDWGIQVACPTDPPWG